jgi:hypothetical protein
VLTPKERNKQPAPCRGRARIIIELNIYSALTRRRDPPDCVADIVSNENVAAFIESKPNWPTARFFVEAKETSHDVLGGAVWMSVRKRHIHDFVAIELRPVPAAVFADERAAVIGRGQGASGVKLRPSGATWELRA